MPRILPKEKKDKLAQAAAKGMTIREAAAVANVSKDTAHKYLREWGVNRQELDNFTTNKASVLQSLQADTLKVMKMVMGTFKREEIDALDARQRGSLARDLAVVTGCIYDKHRLETGQSTSNTSVLFQARAAAERLDKV